jgi:hypothetical protein
VSLATAKTLEFLPRAQLPLVHVRPAAERPAPAPQYGDTRIRIGIEFPKCRHQLANHFVADCIQFLRSVQCDRGDMVMAVIVDVLPVIVRPFPCSSGLRWYCC